MYYKIREREKCCITESSVVVDNFLNIINEEYEEIIIKMLKEEQLLKIRSLYKIIIDDLLDIIINNKSVDYLNEVLTGKYIPLYSLIINLVNTYKMRYQILIGLKNAEEVEIECNKDNLLLGLELAKKLDKQIIIDGRNISLSDYQKIFSEFDIDSLNNYNIKIKYQDNSGLLEPRELYHTSIIVNNISKEIEKYNLSPLEKIVYAYDVVKQRKYKKTDKVGYESRDLDKVLKNDFIVCVGFSNMFNAILKNLDIKTIPYISERKKHQSSLVYVKDSKYELDGVYVFDPTNDHKRNDKYINNYNFFGMTMMQYQKIYPCDIYDLINSSFNEWEGYFDSERKTSSDKLIKLMKLFDFIDDDNYANLEEILGYYEYYRLVKRETAREIYMNFKDKYNSKDISPRKFLLAILRTRIIEYYEGLVDKVEIDDIKESVIERAIKQKYINRQETLEMILEKMEYDIEINGILNNLLMEKKLDIEKMKQKVCLLKVLKNKYRK